MKQKILLSILFIMSSCVLFAQKEAAHWFFGQGCGLNFLDTHTVTDANGISVAGVPKNESSPLNTNEGCFSLSDKDGNIIVFSDGMRVYNKNKQLIASGLNGHTSSAQSGILIPYPETPGKYFIISNRQSNTNSGGLFYSIFDSAGNGSVTNINTPITQSNVSSSRLYENVTSVKHANGNDFWLLNRTAGYFFAWHITKTGFPSSPTVTTIPGTASTTGMGSQGYMKMSPDGKMVCHTSIDGPNGEVMFADFNNQTGGISNIKLRNWQFGGNDWQNRFYSLEFSPQGKNLFLSFLNTPLYVIPTNQIATGTPQLVAGASQVGTVQTGPDGRIYGIQSSNSPTKLLAIIPNPDDDISQLKVHIFNNYLSGGAIWGLPTFVASFFSLEGDKSFCMKTSKDFTVFTSGNIGGTTVAYTQWNWGDGSAEEKVMGSGQQIKSHTYKRSGKFTITVSAHSNTDGLLGSPQTMEVKVASCIMPVNHNISVVY